MPQFTRLLVAALAVVAMLVFGTLAPAAAPEKAGQAGQPIVIRSFASRFPAVPEYYPLQMPHVQKYLELLPKQVKQLEDLGKEYSEQMQEYSRQDWAKVREMDPEERNKFYAEWREKRQKQVQHFQEEIKKTLAPHQQQLLKEYNVRTRAMSLLRSPRILEQLEASEDQKKAITKIRDELQGEIQRLSDQTFGKMRDVLNEEQQKKLEELSTQGFRGTYAGQAVRGR